MAVVTRKITRFTDIDPMFMLNPASNDITLVSGVSAIKASVRHIVLTSMYERPFEPELGTIVNSLLFENWDISNKVMFVAKIRETLERYEPRIEVAQVLIDDTRIDSYELAIEIHFNIIALQEFVTITIVVDRLR